MVKMKRRLILTLSLALAGCTLGTGEHAAPLHTKEQCEAVLRSATGEQARLEAERTARGEPKVMIVGVTPPKNLGASKAERLAAFMRLYELGESVERWDEYFYTGLGYACALGNAESVQKILALKPNLKYDPHRHDEEDEDCHCADGELMPGYVQVALENGHKELAQDLLKRGAAPTGVLTCIRQGDMPMLRELLAAGAKLSEDDAGQAFVTAKGVEMLRFLKQRYKRCPRAKDILSNLHWNGKWYNVNEEEQRAYLLQAGIITPNDIAAFDRSLR